MSLDKKLVPLPLQRIYRRRVSEEMKSMQPGQSFVCDYPTAQSFKMFAKYHQWESCQQRIDENQIRVWRTK